MLMKKFVAPTSREAMQKMKNELGPDALVISNRKVTGGVEILAMVENEVPALEAAMPAVPAAPAPVPQPQAQMQPAQRPQVAPQPAPQYAAQAAPQYAAQPPQYAAQQAAHPGAFAPARQNTQPQPQPSGRPQRASFESRVAASRPAAPVAPANAYQTLKDFAKQLDNADTGVYGMPAGPAQRPAQPQVAQQQFAQQPAPQARPVAQRAAQPVQQRAPQAMAQPAPAAPAAPAARTIARRPAQTSAQAGAPRARSANPFANMPAARALKRAKMAAAPAAAPVAAPVAAPAVAPAPVPVAAKPAPAIAPAARPAAPAPVAAPAAAERPMPSLANQPSDNEARLLGEVKAMKALLQSQLQGFAFRDMSQRRPLAMKFWRELADAGFSATVTRTVVDKLPDDLNEAQARKWLGEVLSRNLRCADASRDLVEAGGTYALVGPTGVGKTTTIAKLAARCVVKYGAQSLGLITTDSYRIGAFDQLAIYGKILGVKVHSAQSYNELQSTLAGLRGKRLILIDTTGMGQRDSRLAEQINLLDMPEVQRVLLLNAGVQAETLDDVARAYQGKAAGARPLTGVVFSKIDEAAKLGPVMDTAMRHSLDVFYVSTGQRVPEDLHPAKAQVLVHRALKAAADPIFALRDDEVPLRAITNPAHA
jgi:flagellar biosynthesis protein FlhF